MKPTLSPNLGDFLYIHMGNTAKTEPLAFRCAYVCNTTTSPLLPQVELVEQLCVVAGAVKASRDAQRQTTLVQELKRVSDTMVGSLRLPLDPAMQVCGIDIEVSSDVIMNSLYGKAVCMLSYGSNNKY